jgi:hypothetical protein
MIFDRLTTGLALAALLTACAGDGTNAPSAPSYAIGAGHNSAVHTVTTTAVNFGLVNPCNSETIQFSGTQVVELTNVATEEDLANGFVIHNQTRMLLDATGTGSVTGATYEIHQVSNQDFESPSPAAPSFEAKFQIITQVTSSVDGLDFRVHQLVHGVLSPTMDQVLFTRNVLETSCRG